MRLTWHTSYFIDGSRSVSSFTEASQARAHAQRVSRTFAVQVELYATEDVGGGEDHLVGWTLVDAVTHTRGGAL